MRRSSCGAAIFLWVVWRVWYMCACLSLTEVWRLVETLLIQRRRVWWICCQTWVVLCRMSRHILILSALHKLLMLCAVFWLSLRPKWRVVVWASFLALDRMVLSIRLPITAAWLGRWLFGWPILLGLSSLVQIVALQFGCVHFHDTHVSLLLFCLYVKPFQKKVSASSAGLYEVNM